jgi:ABC-2 type transport system ATP-binding protein
METLQPEVILSVDSLKKKFGAVTAVDNISLKVYRGEIFGFLGPNGAGKTTSIRMMCGLLRPDSGKIAVTGANGKRSVGICPQNIAIWENLTCVEQLSFMGEMHNLSPRESKNSAVALLESLGLAEKRDKLAKTLSGGMQRRLNIALALVHSPALVFLDEPQAGLDPQSRVLVRDYLRSIKERTTVVLTTHDMEEAEKLSDRICIMDKGRILAMGATEEIKKSSGENDLIEVEIEGAIETELFPFLGAAFRDGRITSPRSAEFRMADPYGTLEDILATVRQKAVKVSALRLRKKSLEDIFIRMTGRSLRE